MLHLPCRLFQRGHVGGGSRGPWSDSVLTQHNGMGHLPSNYIWRRWVWGWCRCCCRLVGLVPLGWRVTPSKAKRVPPSMNGDGDELWLLENDIVVHESWWCCGPQIAVEEDIVVKLGPLVAVVVVEAAAAASAASAAAAATAAADVCCLLSAACPSHMLRHHASLCLLPCPRPCLFRRHPQPRLLGIIPQPLRCRSWGSAIMRANLAQMIHYRERRSWRNLTQKTFCLQP